MMTGKDARDISLIVLAVSVLFGIVGYAWYVEQRRVYPPDYCPTDTWPQRKEGIRIPGRTAIVIDTSNAISVGDRTGAFVAADAWARADAPFLQQLSFYGLPESYEDGVKSSGESFCVPKEGDDANLIYENPVFVEADFRHFLSRLDSILGDLLSRREADQSPIVETMAELVDRHDDLDYFLLVSDMLQNTPAWSHYDKQGDPALAAMVCGRITTPGNVKAVYVYYIDRPEARSQGIQAQEWPDEWWRNCLGDIETRMLNGPM